VVDVIKLRNLKYDLEAYLFSLKTGVPVENMSENNSNLIRSLLLKNPSLVPLSIDKVWAALKTEFADQQEALQEEEKHRKAFQKNVTDILHQAFDMSGANKHQLTVVQALYSALAVKGPKPKNDAERKARTDIIKQNDEALLTFFKEGSDSAFHLYTSGPNQWVQRLLDDDGEPTGEEASESSKKGGPGSSGVSSDELGKLEAILRAKMKPEIAYDMSELASLLGMRKGPALTQRRDLMIDGGILKTNGKQKNGYRLYLK
jgi:hypothetical protein